MHMDLATIALLGASLPLTTAALVALQPAGDTVAGTGTRRWTAGLLLAGAGWAIVTLPFGPAPWLLLLAGFLLLALELRRTADADAASWPPVLVAGAGAVLLLLLAPLVSADAGRRAVAAALLGLWLLQAWPLRHALRSGGTVPARWMLALLAATLAVPAGLLWRPDAPWWQAALAVAPVLLSFGFVPLHADLERRRHRTLEHVDALTGALNRRGIVRQSRRLFASSLRHGRGLALLMVQIDHFGRLRSIFGAAAEPLFLPPVHACLQHVLRTEDVLARSDADTFVVLLPESDPAGAADAAERIRDAVRRLRIDTPRRTMQVTASIGVATMVPGDRDLQPMLQRAATVLAVARREGCNRVTTRPPRFRTAQGSKPPSLPGREAHE